MRVKVTTRRHYVNPGFRLPVALYRKIGKEVVVGSIIDNVVTQRQADGSPLKRNPPNYREEKRRRGWTARGAVMSLVAVKHRFTRASSWRVKAGRDRVSVRPVDDFAPIVEGVQEHGYTGWFDIGATGLKALQGLITEWVRDRLRRAQR